MLAGLVALLASAEPAAAKDACEGTPGSGAVKLTVQVVHLRSAKGQVTVTVYPDDPHRFLAHHAKLLRQRVPAALPVTSSCFWLRPGVYALALYHDENQNGDFDRNPVGIPVEGFGFSNDAPTRFSLPAFDAVRFRLPPEGRTMRVTMRYP
jgi:uncharacterized protein (DUF2141 family)